MGNKRMKHLNELRVKALAGDRMAQQALERETYVPHHLRRIGTAIDRYLKRSGVSFKQGLAITAKTLKPRRTRDAVTIDPDYGYDRLQMLKDRRERRAARLAAA